MFRIGMVILCACTPMLLASSPGELKVPADFRATRLMQLPRDSKSSWVATTPDPKGRLIVSAQFGHLFRITVGDDAAHTKIAPIDTPLGSAQGLAWAGDCLYATVNGVSPGGLTAGVYKMHSPDRGDTFDQPELILPLKNREGANAAGEHGPHGIRVAPNGSIYLIAGNATEFPLATSSPARNWQEDTLLPCVTDALDPNVFAPGGWLAHSDPSQKHWQLLCIGLRNSYDFDFNPDGEIFTFDSDMEWDVGTAWYRATRIQHLVSGGEYGWRNGSAKFEDHWIDRIPPVLNVGLSSPTGMTFGKGLRFPTRYQRMLFCADWSYGRILAVNLSPKKASYDASCEVFASRRPLCLTDLVVLNGDLYAITGGRGTQSELWKIEYSGSESTAPQVEPVDEQAAKARQLRHRLEAFHSRVDPAAVDFAWPNLASDDPFIRYAARMAIEAQPVATWQSRALAESNPESAIPALLALARCGKNSNENSIIDALLKLNLTSLGHDSLLDSLRALQITFCRLGHPDRPHASQLLSILEPLYPASDRRMNRDLCQLLVYLDAPDAISKTAPLLSTAPGEDQIFYATMLRRVSGGWTIDQRRQFFQWIRDAQTGFKAGLNRDIFLRQIRDDALKTLSATEKVALRELIEPASALPTTAPAALSLVRHWTMGDLLPYVDQATHNRSFATGKSVFQSASCLKCHNFGSDGQSVGPELTTVGNRMTPEDILESMIEPSKVISDQYATTDFILRSGRLINGRVDHENKEEIFVRTSPLSSATTKIRAIDVATRRISKLSPMPTGLLDVYTRDQILDLIAYLRSGGNPMDDAFARH